MNKKLLHIAIGLSLLLPLSTYAEEVSSVTNIMTKGITTTTVITINKDNKDSKEVKEKEKDAKDDAKSTQDTLVVSTTTASSTSPIKTFTLCSQQAIETRDTKIAASRSVYNAAMTAALADRKNKEKAAVAIVDVDDQKAAIKVAVDAYKNLTKTAQNNLVASRKAIWQNFETDIKTCHEIQDETVAVEKTEKAEKQVKESTGETPGLRKIDDNAENKTIKDSIFNTIRSLFN